MPMNWRVVRVVTLAVCLHTSVSAQTSGPPPQPTTIEGATTHVYKTVGGTELRLHVFGSPGGGTSSQKPAIVFFFGGAWTSGPVTQFVPQATHLVERGMVAVLADYRVFGRHKTTGFEAIADAKSAVRWIRANAKTLGIDPNRLAAGGGSSGGHIALSAAVLDVFDEVGEDKRISSKPTAVVLFNPVVNTSHDTPSVLKERFGDRAREASPMHHLHRGLPPTLILHGKADTTVPYADVEQFCVESTKLGNQCQVVGYDGAGHGFFNAGRDGGKWYQATVAEMDRFLAKLGYLSGPVK